ncbi:MAG TPA: bifunctional YncE family protein/alkaline phosphatase family protein [Candidatus Solibacter sp.]|nr:bifunctional YncE family protein/alkaline phosphatase family protein [Candidatus Solibacter sp.]
MRLDPEGEFVDLSSMPLGMALAPDGKKLVVVLSGWREQGIQVVDLATRRVTQTLAQEAAFYGAAFSADGKELYVSGGNEDLIYCYSWSAGVATLDKTIVLGQKKEDKTGSRYPAGLAASKRGNFLYVVENVGDSLAVVDPALGKVVQRFSTDHYPYAVEVAADGNVYVSAWGGHTLSIFRTNPDGTLFYTGRLDVGQRPSALKSNLSGSRLFVALAGTDRIAVVDTHARKVLRYLKDEAPGAPAQGSTPNALNLSRDGSKLFVAEADNNAVAVFNTAEGAAQAGLSPVGRIPTDWYPTDVLEVDKRLLILNGKGHGSYANPDGPTPGKGIQRPLGYDLGQLNGTLRFVSADLSPARLAQDSRRVADANGWDQKRSTKRYPPFKHVIYIVKENRTYDQVLGDMKEGDGDPNLVFFGQDVSPNHHALALRFGLFDRFFTNAEVSGQGHVWSLAAYVTDYSEKAVVSMYSNRRADLAGDEADNPLGGYLWNLAAKKGIWFRDYGDIVVGPDTSHDLPADVSSSYPETDLEIPDQKRADAWIEELHDFVRKGDMPALSLMYLPRDHTVGGAGGHSSPRACMADNDLALGRIVEALSQTPFWRDTVVFVLEDDSQAGPDHVDSHRSPFLAISAYGRSGTVHRFANTTDVLAAIEDILGLGRMSKFDYFSRSLADMFAATPDLTPYSAMVPKVDLKEMNPAQSSAARMSEGLDFSAPDRIDDALFNRILWAMLKPAGTVPPVTNMAPVHALQLAR